MTEWRDIESAPACQPVRVKTETGFECAAEFFKWSCTGVCTPPGQRIHTPHMHSAWVMVDENGDQLQTACGDMAEVEPIGWQPLPDPPDCQTASKPLPSSEEKGG